MITIWIKYLFYFICNVLIFSGICDWLKKSCIFFEKSYKNIWWFQKKVVSLHRN